MGPRFQSPSRDCGRSGTVHSGDSSVPVLFQSPSRDCGRSGRWRLRPGPNRARCFNPPVGIVAVQAFAPKQTPAFIRAFQSPSRDCGRSGRNSSSFSRSFCVFQSPSRDCGRSGQRECVSRLGVITVSIPQSGLWPFRPRSPHSPLKEPNSFNPPVGIVAVQASTSARPPMASSGFQSPSRDCGRSGSR